MFTFYIVCLVHFKYYTFLSQLLYLKSYKLFPKLDWLNSCRRKDFSILQLCKFQILEFWVLLQRTLPSTKTQHDYWDKTGSRIHLDQSKCKYILLGNDPWTKVLFAQQQPKISGEVNVNQGNKDLQLWSCETHQNRSFL